jgi:dihydroxyacetone kinase
MTDALRKTRIELEAEHQPQYVHHDSIDRISRADEQELADTTHRDNAAEMTHQLVASIRRLEAEIEFLEMNVGRVIPGRHRDDLRMTRRGIRNLTQKLSGIRHVV